MKCEVCQQDKPAAREHKGQMLCADCEPTEAGFVVYKRWMDAALKQTKEHLKLRENLVVVLADRLAKRGDEMAKGMERPRKRTKAAKKK